MTIAYYDIIAVIMISAFLVLRYRFNFASRSIAVLALLILFAAAIAGGLGATSTANDLAILAFYAMGVGVILLAYDQYRAARGPRKNDGVLRDSIMWMRRALGRLRS